MAPKQDRAPWNEAERLAALRRYGILDTASEAVFDDFVQIAADACEAPIAVVNLVDAARQWFAAERGLGIRETPLDVSICAHAILQPGLFVVPDLTKDPRFDCNPLVLDRPGLRFYAGALLQTAEGLPIGTMCVLDYTPRPQGLTERQRFTLGALARQVMAQLELRRTLKEKELLVQEVHHRVKNSLATVQALLTLQARATGDPGVAEQLKQSAARVQAFGKLHERLYRVGAAAQVEISAYLQDVLEGQDAAFAPGLEGRRITFDAVESWWPASDAPALGMVVVELVTNALKYGRGTITVRFRLTGEDAVLTVEDEGGDLPADFDPARSTGLGMRVETGLLGGSRLGRIEVDRSRGHTCFVARLRAPMLPG